MELSYKAKITQFLEIKLEETAFNVFSIFN